MLDVLSYHILRDKLWLADDEKTWTDDFSESAGFTTAELANDIAKRECGDAIWYVMACMATGTAGS